MTTLISPDPLLHFTDSNGNLLSGGKLFTYQAGTTTKQATYTDSSGNTANTNPIILNSRGECNCWLTPGQSYKFVLSPSTDTDPPTNPIWTVDNIIGGISVPLAVASGGTGATSAASALTNLGGLALAGGTMTGGLVMSGASINEASSSLASAATTNIGGAAANYIFITGTTTITGFDVVQSGVSRTLEFAGSLTLTNSASLILPTGANITTAAGDTAIFRSEGSGNWRCVSYTRANGTPLLVSAVPMVQVQDRRASGTAGDTPTASTWNVRTLQTKNIDTSSIASLASNQVTLPAGTYEFDLDAVPGPSEASQFRLFDVTNSVVKTDVGGQTIQTLSVSNTVKGPVHMSSRITLAGTVALRIEWWTDGVTAVPAITPGGNEVYTIVTFRKVA